MAPPPENDNTPKAPDKGKGDKHAPEVGKDKTKDFKTLNNLNDCELKDLLDEAITYKNPKDREGKSTLFKELLIQAEESERNARAASAGGSEQVRYCNTTAKRSKHRRKPNSISENVMHGGSLDNLAKEELFEVVHHLRPKRTVSARQREGGSLPSNVNAGGLSSYDPHFLEEEARRKRSVWAVGRAGGGVGVDDVFVPEPMDVDIETVSLLDHDSVAENFDKGQLQAAVVEQSEGGGGGGDGNASMAASFPSALGVPKYTSKATLQVNVDDALHFNDLERADKKSHEIEQISAKVLQSKYRVFIPYYANEITKKVDENANALHHNVAASKTKKKKIQSDKNVVCRSAEEVKGHRSDIIDDMDKLLEYIGENKRHGGRANHSHRSNNKHALHKQPWEEGGGGGTRGKKQRAQSSKTAGKDGANGNRPELKKSNSLGEISTTKLDNFAFDGDGERPRPDDEEAVPAMQPNENDDDHRSVQNFYPSTENIETTSSSEFRVVTKKKKMKKRRTLLSGSRRKSSSTYQTSNTAKSDGERTSSSPVQRQACSVPQSERSNDDDVDSSDVDSIHSLPIDAGSGGIDDDAPVSYASIARNAERKQQEQQQQQQQQHNKKSPPVLTSKENQAPWEKTAETTKVTVAAATQTPPKSNMAPPPDVHNIKNFPSINKSTKVAATSTVDITRVNNSYRSGGNGYGRNSANYKPVSGSQCNGSNDTDVSNNGKLHQQTQNNFTILQASEVNAMQYNSQMIPTMNIPDVQTIEKNYFLNQQQQQQQQQQLGRVPQHQQPPIHLTQHHHHHHQQRSYRNHHHHPHHVQPLPILINNHPQGATYMMPGPPVTYVNTMYVDQSYFPSKDAFREQPPPVSANNNVVVPDNQRQLKTNVGPAPNDDSGTISAGGLNSEGRQPNKSGSSKTPKTVNQDRQPRPKSSSARDAANCDNNSEGSTTSSVSSTSTNNNNNKNSRQTPVVIMSVEENKEVSGLVFGFDVNEQLLSEDICDDFVSRYVVPSNYTASSHNHDKLVQFIGLAWEDAINSESSGEAKYYSDSL